MEQPTTKETRQIASRATEAEFAKRVESVIAMLGKGARPSIIKRMASEQWGVRPRTLEHYLCRAREAMMAEEGTNKPEMRSRALAYYQSTLMDKTATRKERDVAWEAIRRMLGLDSPDKLSVTHREMDGITDAEIDQYIHEHYIGGNGNGSGHKNKSDLTPIRTREVSPTSAN